MRSLQFTGWKESTGGITENSWWREHNVPASGMPKIFIQWVAPLWWRRTEICSALSANAQSSLRFVPKLDSLPPPPVLGRLRCIAKGFGSGVANLRINDLIRVARESRGWEGEKELFRASETSPMQQRNGCEPSFIWGVGA